MAAGSTGSAPFPRWQLAIALGATATIGLGYWYYSRQHSASRRAKGALASGGAKSLSIDDTGKPEAGTKPNETPLERAQRYKNEGNQFFKKGDYDGAIEMYDKAVEACPPEQKTDVAIFYQNRAAAHEQQKKWAEVIEDCNRALELNHKYEKALYRRARAFEIQQDWEKCLDDITCICLIQGFQNQNALQMADRVLRELGKIHAAEAMKNKRPKLSSKQFIKTYFMSFSEDPVHALLMNTDELLGEGELTGFRKAKLAFAKENFEDIIPACSEEINSSEAESRYNFEALSLRATFHILSGSHKEALEDLNAIISSKDVDVRIKVNALIKRASLCMQNDDVDSSIKDFEKAVELGPNISDVYHHRGQILLLTEKVTEARQDFQRAVSLNPESAIAAIQKCYADYRFALISQDPELLVKIMQEFRTNTEKFKWCSEAYVLYAQVLAEREEFQKADELYLKALEVDPENVTVIVQRGLLLLQWKGDMNGAVDLMKEAIKLDSRCQFAYETLGTMEVQRGNLVIAIDLFNKAINLARTEVEMAHLFTLRDAAVSQLKNTTRLGIGPILKTGA